jgi:WD40 repeat protein
MGELRGAIDNCATFIYVISPRSVASEVCDQELAQAVSSGKKIIPVVWDEVPRSVAPPTIGQLSWIFLADENTFTSGLEKVLLALATDLVHRHEAAHLLVRARRWEANKTDRSLTLRGAELAKAEQWLAAAASLEPRPTPLHAEYVLRSRALRLSAQRRLVAVLSAVSVLLLALSTVSIVLYGRARAAQTQAQEAEANAVAQRDTAIDRQADLLASEADSDLAGNQPDQALLVALKANAVRDTYRTRSSLAEALTYSPHLLRVLKGHQPGDGVPSDGVSDVVFDRTGTLFSGGAGDGQVFAWNTATGRRTQMVLPRYRHHYGVFSVSMSPDGTLVATGGYDGVWVFNRLTGQQVAQLEITTDTIDFNLNQLREYASRLVAFSPDGRELVTARCARQPCGPGDGVMVVWDTATWKANHVIDKLNPVTAIAFNPAGTLLATGTCGVYAPQSGSNCAQGQVQLWDPRAGVAAGSALNGHSSQVLSVAFSPDGSVLASGGNDNAIVLWSVATRRASGQPLVGHGGPVNRLAFSPDGRILASAGGDRTVRLWNVASHDLADNPLLGHDAPVEALAFSPDGTQIATGDLDDTILLWRTSYDTPLGNRAFLDGSDGINAVAVSHDATLIAAARSDGYVSILRPDLSTSVAELSTFDKQCTRATSGGVDSSPCFIVGVAFAPDDRTALALTGDGRLFTWSASTWQRTGAVLHDSTACTDAFCIEGEATSLAISPDGKTAAVGGCAQAGGLAQCHQGKIILWDLTTQRLITYLHGHTDEVTSLAFSPDGSTLLSGGNDKDVIVWSMSSHTILGHLRGHNGPVSGLAVAPDGKTIASYAADGTVRLWNAATLAPEGAPIAAAPSGAYGGIAFSPDSVYLATGTWAHEVTIWRTADRAALYQPFPHPGQVETVTFSPDGQHVISADQNGVIANWDIQITGWKTQACAIADRNLTTDEADQFSPGHPDLCPGLPPDASVALASLAAARTSFADHNPTAAADAYGRSAQQIAAGDAAELNNNICGEGSYVGFADRVMPACDRAVSLAPGDGSYIDSRGFARARTGDLSAAAADFQYFVDWATTNNLYDDHIIQERRDWVTQLRQSQNPFTPTVLNAIHDEYVE